MNSNKLIAFLLTLVVVICSLVSPALAADVVYDKWGNIREEGYVEPESVFQETIDIISRDESGYETTLLSFDAEKLEFEPISTFSVLNPDEEVTAGPPAPDPVPHPDDVAVKVPGLADIARERSVPYCANFVFIDFGPNWEDAILEESTWNITGRYVYLFVGVYDEDYGEVLHDDVYIFKNAYYWDANETDPANSELAFDGPYALCSYNPDDNAVTVVTNTYAFGNGHDYNIFITGIVAKNDTRFPDFWPRVVTWGALKSDTFGYNYDDQRVELTLQFTSYDWDYHFDGDVEINPEGQLDFFDWLLDGLKLNEDDPIVKAILNALKGLGDVFEFLKNLPSTIGGLFNFLPPAMADFLVVSLGVIVAFLLIKFVLHIVG